MENLFYPPPNEIVLPHIDSQTIWQAAKKFDPYLYRGYFEENYPKALALIKLGGIYPNKAGISPDMEDPYNQTMQKGNYTNIGEHVISAGFCFQAVAKPLLEVDFLTEEEFDQGTEGALIHDASKRWELMRRDYARKNPGYEPYSDEAYKTVHEILVSKGVEEDLIKRMVESGKESGAQSFRRFIEITDENEILLKSRRMVDKILHLADDMTATTNPEEGSEPATAFLTPLERMIASNFKTRYKYMWVDGLAFDEQSVFVDNLKDVSNYPNLRRADTYAFYQSLISNAICRQIQTLLSSDSCELPEYYVKNLVNNSF